MYGTAGTGPRIAVVVVNYNSGAYLARCMTALAAQTVAPERVVVVDNASSDDSAVQLAVDWPGVELVNAGGNLGFAAANNLAVHSLGDIEWVALLNPDAFPEPGWLAALARATREHPDCGFFASRLLAADGGDTIDGTGDVYHVSGLVWRRDHGRRSAETRPAAGEVFAACAAAALYRRDAFLGVGGFDERFFCYLEDVDLAFRLRLAGYAGRYVPDAVATHVGSGTTGRHSAFSLYHGHRNLVWTYCKNMPALLFWLYLPQHLLLNLVSVLWFALRGQGRTLALAKWHALRGLPPILRDRLCVQAARRVRVRALREQMATGWLTPYRGRHGG